MNTSPKGGRPRGARNKFSKAFIEALAADFLEHKDEVIRIVRVEDPVKYFQVCASLVPKEVLVEGSELFSEWSDDELAVIRSASSRSSTPSAVVHLAVARRLDVHARTHAARAKHFIFILKSPFGLRCGIAA